MRLWKVSLTWLLMHHFTFCSTELARQIVVSTGRLSRPACDHCRSTSELIVTPVDQYCQSLKRCRVHRCNLFQTGLRFECESCPQWASIIKWRRCEGHKRFHRDCSTCGNVGEVNINPYLVVVAIDILVTAQELLLLPQPDLIRSRWIAVLRIALSIHSCESKP
ncbi:hypothetical protein PSHT_15047 [Puccinia striiformis]|uniref:Uncharacterized protein n=1 Tax=Puccinia striiformis TaxID=27350 RepID=A0A2S4UH29_9BASI|nr:hypothetical protein PSHT_15047 [Puccinia striiformis]